MQKFLPLKVIVLEHTSAKEALQTFLHMINRTVIAPKAVDIFFFEVMYDLDEESKNVQIEKKEQ